MGSVSVVRATIVLVLAAAVAGCGGGPTGSNAIEGKLRRHLAERSLSVKWVRCVPSVRSTYRCNVDFGELHIQIYCAALVEGRLRAAEWRPTVHGRQNRAVAARECARRLSAAR